MPLSCGVHRRLLFFSSYFPASAKSYLIPLPTALNSYFLTTPLQSECLVTTPISSCAASNPAFLSAVCATNATENVPSAIPTCAPRLWSASATSALSVITRTSVWSAVARASVMRSTALNVRVSRRTAMDAPRSSIWEVRGRICSIKRKVSGINDLQERLVAWCPSGGEPSMSPAGLQCSA